MIIRKMMLLMSALLCMVWVFAQEESKKETLFVIEGHFFKEIPVSRQQVSHLYILKSASGTTAMGIRLHDPLPDKALKYAIPANQIAESDQLLKQFKEKQLNAKGAAIQVSAQPLLKVGSLFPAFTATDITGKSWSQADVKGKVMVLNLWFTGCKPCRAEMPELSAWKNEMPDVMFFSSTFEDAATARPVLEQQQFNWIPLVNDNQFKAYVGNNGYPVTIVIDKQGCVAKVEYGTSPVQREELKEKIQSLR